jgi:ABC-type dipeptide/oligopeptide/nickel transport system ATPase subunit
MEEVLAEPLVIQHPELRCRERDERIRLALAAVELPQRLLTRRPLELSGGQRQRAGIARALVQNPKLLILDEALSALDLSAQNQIANILRGLRNERKLGVLLITHDLEIAGILGDRRLELSNGRLEPSPASNQPLTANQQLAARTLSRNSTPRETVEGPNAPCPSNRC